MKKVAYIKEFCRLSVYSSVPRGTKGALCITLKSKIKAGFFAEFILSKYGGL